MFSKGFMPVQFQSVGMRARIEDVSKQTFIGFVSQLSELKNKSLWSGNAYQSGRLKYTCADFEDFVKSAGFVNKKQAQVAVVEQLCETGTYNERSGNHYANDASFSEDYPWAKT